MPTVPTSTAVLSFVACLLAGCSVTGPRSSPLPHDGETMVDIYKRHMREEMAHPGTGSYRPMRGAADDPRGQRVVDLVSARADAPLQGFERLPNPDLELYVFPHLAKGRHPVPGYATVFPMYETVQYALPGEVEPSAGRTVSRRSANLESGQDQPDAPPTDRPAVSEGLGGQQRVAAH